VTAVSVLVPWRPDGPERSAAWEWLRRWWAAHHPDWQLVTGTCPDGSWRKGAAVADAAARAGGQLLVVADADVLCAGLPAAVDQVAAGRTGWAMPHQRVYRLARAATAELLADGRLPLPPGRPGGRRRHGQQRDRGVAEAHPGVAGGGMVVLPAGLLAEVPMDPRFEGWGQEDESWAVALTVLAGPGWRGNSPLWHLWHPPQPRVTRRVGSQAGEALAHRYRLAAAAPGRMRALLAEQRPNETGPSVGMKVRHANSAWLGLRC
jgi:hypothetical protein